MKAEAHRAAAAASHRHKHKNNILSMALITGALQVWSSPSISSQGSTDPAQRTTKSSAGFSCAPGLKPQLGFSFLASKHILGNSKCFFHLKNKLLRNFTKLLLYSPSPSHSAGIWGAESTDQEVFKPQQHLFVH